MKYKDQKENEARIKADLIAKELPSFVRQFFMAEENHLAGMTLYSYASQLKTFFEFLRESNPYFGKKEMLQIRPGRPLLSRFQQCPERSKRFQAVRLRNQLQQ